MTRAVDETPVSEFIVKMRSVFRRRLAADSDGQKHATEREMAGLMRQYLGRSAWDAAAVAEGAAKAGVADVPRDTSRDQSCHTVAGGDGGEEETDRKLASVGPEAD